MKARLLTLLVILCIGLSISLQAQQQLTLTILKTGEDGGVSVSFDDGEYEGEEIDKVNDDDLDMGWNGEDLNIMTTFLRFQNVTIPQGATIDSARLYIYAHEDESAEARINIFAEAADNSAPFGEEGKITDRKWTTAKLDWDIKDNWTMWKPYHSPDIKSVIQEVVNRTGWVSGNALTVFLQGEDQGASLLDNARDFESFENIEDPADGGDGKHHPERIPVLKIYYTLPTNNLLALTILKTGEDGGVSVSFDDGEYEGEEIDKVNDDDLDMGWEGEDLNIMTTYLRFQNVTIPKGATIDSARLYIYAHEDESAEARINIYAEAADNSAPFGEEGKITDRKWTTAKLDWDIKENWTMWKPYHSPDIKSVIQEVVNRDGWVSGNALTVFLQGEDQGASLLDNARDFESFENIEDPADGGDGKHHPERIPVLKVYYSTNTAVDEFVADINYLTVYPNPVNNGQLHIILHDNAPTSMSIFDMQGKQVLHKEICEQQVTLDIQTLNKGIYLIKAVQNNSTFVQKIVVR